MPEPACSWLIDLNYDGTDYAGWQIQNNACSVQGVLNNCLQKLYNTEIKTSGSSRTDGGVHALDQKVTFLPPETPQIDKSNVMKAVNNFLPDSIRILNISEKPASFSARFEAKAKVYTYLIHRGKLNNPFIRNYCWIIPKELDLALMQSVAPAFIGKHDFAAFTVMARNQATKDSMRQIYDISFKEYGNILAISIIGESFLYKMVRRMIGFLVEVGLGRFDRETLFQCLKSPDRELLYYTAQARGLFLEKVFFNDSYRDYQTETLPFMHFIDG